MDNNTLLLFAGIGALLLLASLVGFWPVLLYGLAALAAGDPVGIWQTEHAGASRLLVLPDLPGCQEQAAAIFDIDAPVWGRRALQSTTQERAER